MDAVSDSVGRSTKSPSKTFPRTWSFTCNVVKNLKKDLRLYPYRLQIKQKLTPADMEFLVLVINHYHINELYLFETTYILSESILYICMYMRAFVCVCVC